jgi:hypothetical protein
MQLSEFKSAPDAVRLILRKEGIKGLYAVRIFSLNILHGVFYFIRATGVNFLCQF